MNIITITLNPALDKTMYFDRFETGKTNKTAQKSCLMPGGKGINVARVLTRIFGQNPLCMGICGSDGTLEALLDKEKISYDFVQADTETRVNIKIIDSEGTCTEANERGMLSHRGAVRAFMRLLDEKLAVESVDYIVIGGSFPQGVDKNVYNLIIKKAKAKNIKVALDCDGDALKSGIDAKPYIIKPNHHELEELIGKKFSTTNKLIDSAYALYEEKGVEILCTLGEEGAFLCGSCGKLFVNAPKSEVKGFSGAGDTFLASYLYTLDKTHSEKKALIAAAATAGAKVETAGMPTKKRIAEKKKEIFVNKIL